MFCFATAEPIIFPLSKKKRKTVTLLGHMFTSVTPLAFRKVKRPAKPNVEGCDVWFRSGGEIWIFMPFLLSNLRAWKREKSRRCCSHFFLLFPFSEVVIARNLNMQIVDHCRFSGWGYSQFGQTARANTQKSRFLRDFYCEESVFFMSFSWVRVREVENLNIYIVAFWLVAIFFLLEGKLSQ